MNVIAFHCIAWGLIGIINLCSKQVSKFNYALTWIMLMVTMVFYYYGV